MLTGDENLVDVDFVVQYRISDLRDWLFGIRSDEREGVIRDAARATVRAVVARNPVDLVLTAARPDPGRDPPASCRRCSTSYRAGVHVQSVQLQDVEPPAAGARGVRRRDQRRSRTASARCSKRRATPTRSCPRRAAARRRR